MQEIIFIINESEESGHIAKCINYSIFTEADTLPELRENVKEAVLCHFDDNETPKILRFQRRSNY